MKIYFGFTVAGSRSSVQAAKRIVAILQAMGHEVLTSHLVGEDAWEADRLVPPQEIFARDMKWLEECDLFVAEVSGSSFGLGFETGYLLGATTKRTILLYQRQLEPAISLLITGNTHPNCVLVPYFRVEELEDLVRKGVTAR
jgi:2'-deoxynucleoside 5'-phosphate N-hydrolase